MPCALCPFTAASSSDERAAVPTPGTALWTWLLRQSWILFFFPVQFEMPGLGAVCWC